MTTTINNLFPVELTAQRQTPLINAATKLFAEHWTGATGKEILVPAHEFLELVAQF